MQGLRAAGSLRDFLASSRGAWFGSGSFLYFHLESGLTGYSLWEDPSIEEVEELATIVEASLALGPHPSLADGREIRTPPTRFFERMSRMVAEQGARFSGAVERLAIVRPPGLSGAAAAGFFSVVKAPYPVELFDGLEPALSWLEQPDAARLARELDDFIVAARGTPALLHRVRAHIATSLPQPEIKEVAAYLAMSERTLHRRLTEHGTSFGDEVGRARVNAAKTLLRESDTPITRIALEVGCVSLSSFSVLFRKWEDTTPSAYRAATRGTPEET